MCLLFPTNTSNLQLLVQYKLIYDLSDVIKCNAIQFISDYVVGYGRDDSMKCVGFRVMIYLIRKMSFPTLCDQNIFLCFESFRIYNISLREEYMKNVCDFTKRLEKIMFVIVWK